MNDIYRDTRVALHELGVYCSAHFDDSNGHQLVFHMDLGHPTATETEDVELAAALLRSFMTRRAWSLHAAGFDPGKQALIEALEDIRAEAWALNFQPVTRANVAEGSAARVPPLPLRARRVTA